MFHKFLKVIYRAIPVQIQPLVKAAYFALRDFNKTILYSWESSRVGRRLMKVDQGYEKYTIISACYNVESYIDDFIQSILKQRLDFKKNIYLICVDDGSTDQTSSIIKKYCDLYPDNIKYIFKPNGGQASARNLGLKYASTEWITFCDPDDLLDFNYFYQVDKHLKMVKNDVAMVACNVLLFKEGEGKVVDSHALRYKFSQPVSKRKINELKENIQLFVNSAFFRKSILNQYKLEQSTLVKPNFEDGLFISQYFLCARFQYALFLKDAKYLYRKRGDENSSLDLSWTDKRRYSDVFKYGYLNMLRNYDQEQVLNEYDKYVYLYEMLWYLKQLVNNGNWENLLTSDDFKKFHALMAEGFCYLPSSFIYNNKVKQCWWYWKVGILNFFKKEKPKEAYAYIDQLDSVKNQIRVRIYWGDNEFERFTVDGNEVFPTLIKENIHKFGNLTFLKERIYWVPISKRGTLELSLDGINVRFNLKRKLYSSGVPVSDIWDSFSLHRNLKLNSKYKGAWLCMDRNVYADDNAEHLYRYILKVHPNVPCYFVLSKKSKDWERLASEGFRLIEFNSQEHKEALKHCSKIISSQADTYVTDYFGPGSLSDKQFIFLQHGVIKDDLSGWLNSKSRIDLFITSTKAEYDSIVNGDYPYKYTSKEVKLTGMPRHDALLVGNRPEKIILIMPTWRSYIVGKSIQNGQDRQLNSNFKKTEYFNYWNNLLNDTEIRQLIQSYGYKIFFVPHPIIYPYSACFNIKDGVELLDASKISYSELFKKASILITDYSSVAFDMAFLKKAIIYYQFDEKTFFSGKHSYRKGYFDYRLNGFGPVVFHKNQVCEELRKIIENQGKPSFEYERKMQVAFPFRDAHCCERVFQAILDLDIPYSENDVNKSILQNYIRQAHDCSFVSIENERTKFYKSFADN